MNKEAERLWSLGWSVVPIPHGAKHPNREWLAYQKRLPTKEEIQEWWPSENSQGIGVVCGSVSDNLVCLDFDKRDAYDRWKLKDWKLPTATTSRGIHVFFRTPEPIKSGKLCLEGETETVGDIQAEGKLVVLPPTIHPSGYKRTWLVPPGEHIPLRTLEYLGVQRWQPERSAPLAETLLTEGTRHDRLLAVALRLRSFGLNEVSIMQTLDTFNQSACKPPLPADELMSIVKWVAEREPSLSREKVMLPMELAGHLSKEALRERYGNVFQSCETYLDEVEEDVEWLVEGFLPKGYLVVLGGTSKAGKSCFLTALAIAVARGESFMGLDVKEPSSVLWCAYEESRSERAMILREHGELPPNLYVTHEKPLIDTPEGLAVLRFGIEEYGAKLLVIDPLYGANSAESLTDGKSARNALQGLKDLTSELGVTAIVIHHITKNVSAGMTRERFADSNQILATASMDILMDSEDSPDGSRNIRLRGRGRGTFANQSWLVRSKSMTEFELLECGSEVSGFESHKRADLILGALEEKQMTAEELAEELGLPLPSLRNELTNLVKIQKVAQIDKRGRCKVYGLTQPGLAA